MLTPRIQRRTQNPAVLAALSASGVADKGLKSTGSADFQKIWTYMGLPTISLPLLTGESNLPLGVQLIGDKLDDIRFLSTANWLEKNCKDD